LLQPQPKPHCLTAAFLSHPLRNLFTSLHLHEDVSILHIPRNSSRLSATNLFLTTLATELSPDNLSVIYDHRYTQCGPKVSGHYFFKSKTHEEDTFFIQNKLHLHIYRILRCRMVSEKLPKIPLIRPSLIHQLRLLGYQEQPQSGVLLTSF